MKKFIPLLLTLAALTSCGSTASETSSVPAAQTDIPAVTETVPEGTSEPADISEGFLASESYTFVSADEFANSERGQKIKADGYSVLVPVFDEAKYTLQGINTNSDGNWYNFVLTENSTDKRIMCQFAYNCDYKSPEEWGSGIQKTSSLTTTAVNSGKEYDVYIYSSAAYDDTENYNLFYLPEEGFRVLFTDGPGATQEDILRCFEDISIQAF